VGAACCWVCWGAALSPPQEKAKKAIAAIVSKAHALKTVFLISILLIFKIYLLLYYEE
jgi:hypothetical protein